MQFAKAALEAIPDKPISFEVFSDDFDEMEKQAFRNCQLGTKRVRQSAYYKLKR